MNEGCQQQTKSGSFASTMLLHKVVVLFSRHLFRTVNTRVRVPESCRARFVGRSRSCGSLLLGFLLTVHTRIRIRPCVCTCSLFVLLFTLLCLFRNLHLIRRLARCVRFGLPIVMSVWLVHGAFRGFLTDATAIASGSSLVACTFF